MNMPVIDRELSPKAEKKLSDAFKATSKFGDRTRLMQLFGH
jgi:hypothetical protein